MAVVVVLGEVGIGGQHVSFSFFFLSLFSHFTPTRLSNEPSALACQTSARQESAKMLGVNV